jgi:hypothetical protein
MFFLFQNPPRTLWFDVCGTYSYSYSMPPPILRVAQFASLLSFAKGRCLVPHKIRMMRCCVVVFRIRNNNALRRNHSAPVQPVVEITVKTRYPHKSLSCSVTITVILTHSLALQLCHMSYSTSFQFSIPVRNIYNDTQTLEKSTSEILHLGFPRISGQKPPIPPSTVSRLCAAPGLLLNPRCLKS